MMRPKNKPYLLLISLFLVFSLALFSGCSRAARYEVLTFFFTGVPPLDGPTPEDERRKRVTQADRALAGKSRREQRLAERDRLAALKPFTGPYAHGPWAAEDCDQCHEIGTGEGGFGFGHTASEGTKNIIPGKFVRPTEQLCVFCHSGKSLESTEAAGLHLHGPAWSCTTCHQPHHGKEPLFFRIEAAKLCVQCHGPGFIHDANLHEGVVDCLECHNPHIGSDPRMLREDFEEKF